MGEKMREKKILCIDFDDVIIKTKPLVEKIVAEYCRKATDKFEKLVNQNYAERWIDDETKRILFNEHLDFKNRVLEEVDQEYVGRIDYDQIINIDNIYPSGIEYINYLCKSGVYDEIYILSHYNVEREKEAKRRFIEKYFPSIELIAVPFHKEKYEKNKKRFPTSKGAFFKKYLGIDSLGGCTLIDDSASNGRDWLAHGGNYIRFNPQVANNLSREVKDLFPLDIIAMSSSLKLGKGR